MILASSAVKRAATARLTPDYDWFWAIAPKIAPKRRDSAKCSENTVFSRNESRNRCAINGVFRSEQPIAQFLAQSGMGQKWDIARSVARPRGAN